MVTTGPLLPVITRDPHPDKTGAMLATEEEEENRAVKEAGYCSEDPAVTTPVKKMGSEAPFA